MDEQKLYMMWVIWWGDGKKKKNDVDEIFKMVKWLEMRSGQLKNLPAFMQGIFF
jgi:hypothetical protein